MPTNNNYTPGSLDTSSVEEIIQGLSSPATDKVGEMLGGKGLEMREEHRGITSPKKQGGKRWIKGGGGGARMDRLQGSGWITPLGSNVGTDYQLTSVINPINDAYWSADQFRSRYYDPYVQEAITEPVQSLGGPQAGGGIAAGSEFEFLDFTDPITGESYSGYLATGEGGTAQGDLLELERTLESAQEAYDTALADLTWEEGGLMYDESKEALDKALLQSRVDRQQIVGSKVPAYEQARAAEARTGMDYSAPARQAVTEVGEAGEGALGDITRRDLEARSEFKKAEEKAKKELELAKGIYEDEQADYYTGISQIAGAGIQTGGIIQSLMDMTGQSGIIGAHQAMGEHPKKMAKDTSKHRTGALADAGFYREGPQSIPAVASFRHWLNQDESGPRAFGNRLQASMTAAIANIGEDDNDKEIPENQTSGD